MSRLRALLTLAVATVALAVPSTALAQGCAMCKRNLEENGGAGLIEGFYWSIILLIGTPMTIVGAFAFVLVRATKRAKMKAALKDEVTATG
ncbi:MAG: hypothetical protein ACYTG4_06790 [Planctomycetota bacterium]